MAASTNVATAENHRSSVVAGTTTTAKKTLTDFSLNTSLRSDLDESLLRGVRAEEALSGLGKHWSSNAQSPGWVWEKAEERGGLDDFISHDWATKRRKKFQTLCMIYNGLAAAGWSCLGSALAGLCQMAYAASARASDGSDSPIFPYCGARLVGVIVFVIIFLDWQRLRRPCHPPQWLFVDKLCINQMDEQLKAEGILSLAGFLRHTNRIVVLWTPRYFTRLWCTFELAAWFHKNGGTLRNTEFCPVELVATVPALTLSQLVYSLILTLCQLILPFAYPLVAAMSIAVGAFIAVRILRKMQRQLWQLPIQLETFDVRNARCFCCTTTMLILGTARRFHATGSWCTRPSGGGFRQPTSLSTSLTLSMLKRATSTPSTT
eukprot:TRINITY_DN38508_c0_g1_i2.p1 TRINITY_DN38508_c0_g1~~TRINITY_DN38508_c0_g1_i2.p1  ORF type:complete len:377 (-),score=32.56 TRINITY_DN38508_c0_g1_i2:925-2055(-)